MFKKIKTTETVPIPPHLLDENFSEDVKRAIFSHHRGKLDSQTGYKYIYIDDIQIQGKALVYPSDSHVYQDVSFNAYVYKPEVDEIVSGEVVNITKDGLYISNGISYYFVFISQILEAKVSIDPDKKEVYNVADNNIPVCRIGSIVRGRIVSVSYKPTKKEYESDITLVQKGMGILKI